MIIGALQALTLSSEICADIFIATDCTNKVNYAALLWISKYDVKPSDTQPCSFIDISFWAVHTKKIFFLYIFSVGWREVKDCWRKTNCLPLGLESSLQLHFSDLAAETKLLWWWYEIWEVRRSGVWCLVRYRWRNGLVQYCRYIVSMVQSETELISERASIPSTYVQSVRILLKLLYIN